MKGALESQHSRQDKRSRGEESAQGHGNKVRVQGVEGGETGPEKEMCWADMS